jgi:hypothetical protein
MLCAGMSGKIQADIEPEIDRLYQAPLDEFVQARNGLAARARADGHEAVALRVHSLAKPSVSAWAVNQLYWRAQTEFEALMRAGQQLRAAQEATLAGRGADVREAGKHRDAALVTALDRALDLLRDSGHAPTPAMRLRIATDLDALAAYGGSPPGGAAGRLVEDLDAPGFEVFDGMRAAGRNARGAAEPKKADREMRRPRKRAAAEVVSFEAIANARRAVADAERALSEKRSEAQRAASALDQARADVKAAHAEEARAKSAWDDARGRLEEAERRVPEREQEAERARLDAQDAIAAIERARAALDAVRKR